MFPGFNDDMSAVHLRDRWTVSFFPHVYMVNNTCFLAVSSHQLQIEVLVFFFPPIREPCLSTFPQTAAFLLTHSHKQIPQLAALLRPIEEWLSRPKVQARSGCEVVWLWQELRDC